MVVLNVYRDRQEILILKLLTQSTIMSSTLFGAFPTFSDKSLNAEANDPQEWNQYHN